MPTVGLIRQYGSVLGGLHRLFDMGLIFLALHFATQLHAVEWSDRHPLAGEYAYVALPLSAKSRIVELVNAFADTTASVYVVPDLFLTDLAHARWSSLDQVPLLSVFESPS